MEFKTVECAAAVQARRKAEQAVRDTESALLVSEALSLALKGELATASDKICILDNDVAQLTFALALANASAASREVLCSQILGVAADAVSFADEVLQVQAAAPHRHRSRFTPIRCAVSNASCALMAPR